MKDKLRLELVHAEKKMIMACQNGSKKAWRKYGKKVYLLRKQLNMTVSSWMEETFSKKI